MKCSITKRILVGSVGMKIPRPDAESKEFFKSILPRDPSVTVRPMFGNLSAFVNGTMFLGLFGNDLFVRLSSEDQKELLKTKGVSVLEPMKGKPMKDYVILPRAWRNEPELLHQWVSRSLDWSSKPPPKKTKK